MEVTPLIIYTCAYRLNNLELLARNLVESIEKIKPLVAKNFDVHEIPITWLICKDERTAFGEIGDLDSILAPHGIQYRLYGRWSGISWHNYDENQINYGLMNFVKEVGDTYEAYFYMMDDDNLFNPRMFYSYCQFHHLEDTKKVLMYRMLTEDGSQLITHKQTALWHLNPLNMPNSFPCTDPSKIMLRLSYIKEYGYFRNLLCEIKYGNHPKINYKWLWNNTTSTKLSQDNKQPYLLEGNAYDYTFYMPLIQIALNTDEVSFSAWNKTGQIETYHNGLRTKNNLDYLEKVVEKGSALSHIYITDIDDVVNEETQLTSDTREKNAIITLDDDILKEIMPIIKKYYMKKFKYSE